jgi:ubiquinone/menaquinone biosynthesis C-methylase UbiE
MLDQARAGADSTGMTDRVELRRGDIQVLDLPDASVDTVVSAYTFCTVPNPLAGPS